MKWFKKRLNSTFSLKPKTIVISGINMVEGGIFTILDNCLQKISDYSQNKEIKVIALVNDKSKFDYPNIEYIEFPKSKKSWFSRLYYEYFYFKKLSRENKARCLVFAASTLAQTWLPKSDSCISTIQPFFTKRPSKTGNSTLK